MNETELKKIAEMMRQLDMTAGEAMKNGNLPDAILAYERMMDAEESFGLSKNAGRTRINLANLYLQLDRKEKALEHAQKAAEELAGAGALQDAINARLTQARCLCELDRAAEGVKEAEKAFRDCKTDAGRAEACLVLAECRRMAGDNWKARDAVDRAVRWFESCRDDVGLTRALSERIFLLEQSGQAAAAVADRSRLAIMHSDL